MLRVWLALFVLLHGLVHLWYVTLSLRLVAFQPEMGWNGRSWLLSSVLDDGTLRPLATTLYLLATLAFVAGGMGMIWRAEWWRAGLASAAVFSTVVIVLFWDGSWQLAVQKGLIGVLLNVAILVALLVSA